jgi:hypothetical protein
VVRSNAPLTDTERRLNCWVMPTVCPTSKLIGSCATPTPVLGLPRIVGVDDAAQLQVDRRVARDIDTAVDPGIHVRDIERGHEVLRELRPGAGDIGGERMTLPVRAHDQFGRGDDVSGRRTAGHVLGIGAGGAGKIERGEQDERAGANAERGVWIGLGEDRQQALRPLSEQEGIGRLQIRRRRVDVEQIRQVGADVVGIKLRPRRVERAAGTIGGSERMNFRRRVVDRHLLQRQRRWRQGGAHPQRGAQRINLRRRRAHLLRAAKAGAAGL